MRENRRKLEKTIVFSLHPIVGKGGFPSPMMAVGDHQNKHQDMVYAETIIKLYKFYNHNLDFIRLHQITVNVQVRCFRIQEGQPFFSNQVSKMIQLISFDKNTNIVVYSIHPHAAAPCASCCTFTASIFNEPAPRIHMAMVVATHPYM